MEEELENLLRKTAITAAIVGIVYLVLFFFVDRSVVSWVHENFSETWLHGVGRYISYLAQGLPVRLVLAFFFILFSRRDAIRNWIQTFRN